jgi:hypothetical protein
LLRFVFCCSFSFTALFPYARPDAWAQSARTDVFAACLLRRALVVAAAMIAVGLGA